MSIQSTRITTREEAERRYIEKRMSSIELKKRLRIELAHMDDKELENAIEEEFYNYSIKDSK